MKIEEHWNRHRQEKVCGLRHGWQGQRALEDIIREHLGRSYRPGQEPTNMISKDVLACQSTANNRSIAKFLIVNELVSAST